jgi:hypothetical protein
MPSTTLGIDAGQFPSSWVVDSLFAQVNRIYGPGSIPGISSGRDADHRPVVTSCQPCINSGSTQGLVRSQFFLELRGARGFDSTSAAVKRRAKTAKKRPKMVEFQRISRNQFGCAATYLKSGQLRVRANLDIGEKRNAQRANELVKLRQPRRSTRRLAR